MNVFVESMTFTNQIGVVGIGDIIVITNNGTNVPLTPIVTNSPSLNIYSFIATPAPNDLAETYAVYGTLGSTNVIIQIPPFFAVQPQPESVFVGAPATFSANVLHTTGLQWQFNGTNLVEDGHFFGVTNSVLTISNVTLADAGTYSLVAAHPTSPATNTNAVLSVFKPVLLSLAGPSFIGYQLTASNADGSAFEPERLTNVTFLYSSTPSLSRSNWTLSQYPIALTNGVLQVDFPNDGVSDGYWIMVERP